MSSRSFATDGDVLTLEDLHVWLDREEWADDSIEKCVAAARTLILEGMTEARAVDLVAGVIAITQGEYGD